MGDAGNQQMVGTGGVGRRASASAWLVWELVDGGRAVPQDLRVPRPSLTGVAIAGGALAIALWVADVRCVACAVAVAVATVLPGKNGIPLAPAASELAPAPGEVSVLSLLGEMSRLEHLGRSPPARFGQASSPATTAAR